MLTIAFFYATSRPAQRLHVFSYVDIEVYKSLACLFIIATCITHIGIEQAMQGLIGWSGNAPWALVVSGMIGSALVKATSWAAAAGPTVFNADPRHYAAWALSAGICSGSILVLTASNAGIALQSESRRFPGHAITFRDYVKFGIVCGMMMAAVSCVVFTVQAKPAPSAPAEKLASVATSLSGELEPGR